MTDSLTTLVSKLQAVLLDDGTYFTTATCTAAIRHALSHMQVLLPIQGGTLIDTVADQYEYELTSALAGAVPLMITDVLLQDPDGAEYDKPIAHRPYSEDERLFFRLEVPQPADEQMIVRFTQAHTINGLDSATEGTLSAELDIILLDGAAAQACRIAAAGKVQTNNVDQQVPQNYLLAAASFDNAFTAGLEALTRRRRLQVSVPDAAAWNDAWHNWPRFLS